MGLDQYAYLESAGKDATAKFIWRKHSKLQTFMENLFTTKTGLEAAELNCKELTLTPGDLNALQQLVAGGELPNCDGGFFYGHQFQDEAAAEYAEQDAEFCAWAKTQITAGETVIYSCWW